MMLLGALLGALGATLTLSATGLLGPAAIDSQAAEPLRVEHQDDPWPPAEYELRCGWSRFKIDDSGWSAAMILSYRDLDAYLDKTADPSREVAYPIFPTVYPPNTVDKFYYDYLLKSDIPQSAKVLVIGAGSGADSWVAHRKSGATVYAVDINPMAVANTKALARITGFPIRTLTGSILEVDLPEDFSEFDYVLWNMPFVEDRVTQEVFEGRNFHDGDNGKILEGFLRMLPSLLKEDGKAIVLNYLRAEKWLDLPGVEKLVDPTTAEDGLDAYAVFVIPNLGAGEPPVK